MPMYRATYSYDKQEFGTIEGEADDKDQFEFDVMNQLRDQDDSAHNVEVTSIDEI